MEAKPKVSTISILQGMRDCLPAGKEKARIAEIVGTVSRHSFFDHRSISQRPITAPQHFNDSIISAFFQVLHQVQALPPVQVRYLRLQPRSHHQLKTSLSSRMVRLGLACRMFNCKELSMKGLKWSSAIWRWSQTFSWHQDPVQVWILSMMLR